MSRMPAWRSLIPQENRIKDLLSGAEPLRLDRVHDLLSRESVDVSRKTFFSSETAELRCR